MWEVSGRGSAVKPDDSDGPVCRLLADAGARFCVIGGVAVNAYVDPVVTLDVDLVIASPDQHAVDALLSSAGDLTVEAFPHSVNISARGSDLRLQLQTDPRYTAFVDRAAWRDVMGVRLPVALIDDVLQGKIWAVLDPARRASKRQKDLADIARLVEFEPRLRGLVPGDVLGRLI